MKLWVPKELLRYHQAYWAYVEWFQNYLFHTMKAFSSEPMVSRVCEIGLKIHYRWVLNPQNYSFDETVDIGHKVLSNIHKVAFKLRNEKLKKKYQEGLRQYLEYKSEMEVK